MKKLILAIAICLIPAKVMSSGFINTLGAECARILFNMDAFDYPKVYTQFKNRNSQFYALEQCLKVYKQVGGDIEKLNFKYGIATDLTIYDWKLCNLNKKDGDKECEFNQTLFKDIIVDGYCGISNLIQNKYPNFDLAMKTAIEFMCQKEIEDTAKKINETKQQNQ